MTDHFDDAIKEVFANDQEGPREGAGNAVGKRAPNFTLPDQFGNPVQLSDLCKDGAVLLAFYPGDFTRVCTKQLCNYRDHMADFKNLGIRVVGISPNAVYSHSQFAKKHEFAFKLLSDSKQIVARAFDIQSAFMLGRSSRAVFIINHQRLVLYRYVEATILTHKSSDELVRIIVDLKANKLL